MVTSHFLGFVTKLCLAEQPLVVQLVKELAAPSATGHSVCCLLYVLWLAVFFFPFSPLDFVL